MYLFKSIMLLESSDSCADVCTDSAKTGACVHGMGLTVVDKALGVISIGTECLYMNNITCNIKYLQEQA